MSSTWLHEWKTPEDLEIALKPSWNVAGDVRLGFNSGLDKEGRSTWEGASKSHLKKDSNYLAEHIWLKSLN